ncbi:MAG TPA: hypothetical protein VFI93_10925 [Rhizomicrobium sp.]|nr:hypothetical protein [Rhizomicrobium sp.]
MDNQRAQNADIGETEIRAAFARVAASTSFSGSPRLQEFLRYVVTETLAGRGDRLKGLSIAEAVYSKDVVAEPESDSAVRAEGTRLRRALNDYYSGAGADDPVIIEMPRGGYMPLFVRRTDHQGASDAETAAQTGWGRVRPHLAQIISLVAVVVLAGVVAWVLATTGSLTARDAGAVLPRVAVVPFSVTDSVAPPGLGEGLAADITSRLSRFDGFHVYAAYPDVSADTGRIMKTLAVAGAAYAVTGTVQQEKNSLHVIAQFLDIRQGLTVWSQSYVRDLSVDGLLDIQSDIAKNIAIVLGAPYGVISANETARLPIRKVANLNGYECVLAAGAFFRSLDPKAISPLQACLHKTVKIDPGYAGAWASLALLNATIPMINFLEPDALHAMQDAALLQAGKAVQLLPQDAFAHEALATVHFRRGEYADFETSAKRGLALNPDNPLLLADFGNKYFYIGQYQKGLGMVKRALAMSPAAPSWYHTIEFLEAYRTGKYKRARDLLEKLGPINGVRTAVYRVMTLGQLGGVPMAAGALKELIAIDPQFTDHAAYYFARWQMDVPVTQACVEGLRKAGLPVEISYTGLPGAKPAP